MLFGGDLQDFNLDWEMLNIMSHLKLHLVLTA